MNDLDDPNLEIVQYSLRILKIIIKNSEQSFNYSLLEYLKALGLNEKVEQTLMMKTSKSIKKESEKIMALLDKNNY